VDLDPTHIAQLRRSVAMLSPRCPSALDREEALEILTEMERLQCRDRRLEELMVALRRLVGTSERALRESEPETPHGRGGQPAR
jgi:hypothetical protein